LKTSCTFEHDDDWIRERLIEIRDDPRIAAFYLGDEPLYSLCPGGPATFAARTALVHEYDSRPTFTVIQAYDPNSGEQYPYRYWVGSVDILVFDVYPVSFEHGFDAPLLAGAIAAADALGVPYWAMVQAFQDDYYRLPTPEEIDQQFQLWGTAQRLTGYIVFSWDWAGTNLEDHPDVLDQLAYENGQQ
jgi:hypothetical protein